MKPPLGAEVLMPWGSIGTVQAVCLGRNSFDGRPETEILVGSGKLGEVVRTGKLNNAEWWPLSAISGFRL